MKPDAAPRSSSSGNRRKLDRPPPAIPDHQMLRRIGSGSYGEVWLARNIMGSYRAVKVVYRDQFSEYRPYEREFEGIRNFEPVSRSHPSQISIFQVGRNDADGYFYYVMEVADDQRTGQQIDHDRYEAKTLRSELQRCGRLPVAECLDIGLALTTALQHLHDAGLIHRDVKPSNVIFVHNLPKLADIGLVAAAGDECSFVGTEGYVANEGPGKVQADIFALGKVLYEMLTGLNQKRHPSLPDDWVPDRQAQELNAVVVKACAANVAERYQSAAEMAADLEFVKSGKSVLLVQRLQQAYRRSLVAFAAIILGGLIFGFFVFKNRATEQKVRSELRDVQIARTKHPMAGWFAEHWPRLEKAAAISKSPEVLEQASAMLAGFDVRLVKEHIEAVGGSAAFGSDGRAVIGGLGDRAAILIDTNGNFTQLKVKGEGPVSWTVNGVPLQFTTVSNNLLLRDVLTGAVSRQFVQRDGEQYTNSVPLLAMSPDASSAAAALESEVLVWSAATGELLGRVAANATVLTFSPDGSRLGIGEADGMTRVLSVPSLTNEIVLPRGSRATAIRALVFNRDPLIPYGSKRDSNAWLVATGDQSNEVVIWDLQKRQPPIACRGSIWQVTALAFHPGGLLLASAGQARGKLWDARRGVQLLEFPTGSGQVRFMTFDREGRRLICGSEPGAGTADICLWELEFGRGITPLRGLRAAARKVWFSPDSRRLAALSDEWQLGIWDTSSHGLVALFETPIGDSADIAGGAFDASGKRFAFATGQEACLFDLTTSATIQRWRLEEGSCDQVQFDPRGRLLLLRREKAVGGHWIWRLQELGTAARPVILHQQTETNWSAFDMAFVPGGEQFLVWNDWSPSTEQVLRAYDGASGRELSRMATRRTGGDMRVCLSANGRNFAHTTGSQQPLPLFSVPDFQRLGTTAINCNAIGPSGELVLIPPWFVPSRPKEPRIPLYTDWTYQSYVSAFSPDGQSAAFGTVEGEVLLATIPVVRRWLRGLLR